jgi:hypothetical protein
MAETKRAAEGLKPEIGWHVQYGFKTRDGFERRAAIITRIYPDDGTCTLAVFNPNGSGSQPVDHVRYSAELALDCWTPTPGIGS